MNRHSLLGVVACVTACSLELAPLGPARAKHDGGGAGGAAGSGGFSGGAGGADASAGSGGTATKPGPQIGDFVLGYYWMPLEQDFSGPGEVDLFDMGCKTLAQVSQSFADAISTTGMGKLLDGSVLSYAGACSCPTSPCYLVADAAHPWGYGVADIALEPFRSVAVDPKVIAIGTPLYVPAFDGVTMSDPPFVHDGCVRADDTGPSIVGAQLSFFVGLAAHQQSLDATLGLSTVFVHEGGTRCP